jgi:hypothetical protein
MPAGPGMNIKTDTPLVKKAREGVMEFLLVRPAPCNVLPKQGAACMCEHFRGGQSMHGAASPVTAMQFHACWLACTFRLQV